jgi:hypothetical protein
LLNPGSHSCHSSNMMKHQRNIYIPMPVNMDVISQMVAESTAALERSYTLLSRLDVAPSSRYSLAGVTPDHSRKLAIQGR